MKCPNCGKELPPGESSCQECGQEVIAPAEAVREPETTLRLPQSQTSPASQNQAVAANSRYYPVSRITGVVIFLAGLLLLISTLRFSVPPGKGLGILGICIGAALFGLSFIPWPVRPANAPPPLSPADRITGVFYEPEPVFKNLKDYPRWLAAFLVVAFFSATYQVALMQRLGPERIADDFATRVIDGGFLQNAPISPDDFRQGQIAEAISTATADKITTFLSTIGGTFVVMLILAALYLLGVLAFGGRINFWQALSVAIYSSLPPVVITMALSLILLYIQSPDDLIPLRAQQHGLARADLGLLFSPTESPYLYTFASFIGLFRLYGWWLTVVGLKNTGEKISGGSAWVIALLLWLIGAVLTTTLVMLAPTFTA